MKINPLLETELEILKAYSLKILESTEPQGQAKPTSRTATE
jgi:hypothetical protein